jgi:glycine/D-amino acid oxidase-like deaminating enzyme
MTSRPNASSYVSLWLDEALAAEAPQTTERGQTTSDAAGPLPPAADVLIVGGGFTGLWTAIRLLEHDPGLDVCLIEAKYCGYGASGRNGGIAEGSWAKFPAMLRLYGQDEALRLATMIDTGLTDLRAFCDHHKIDAEIRHRGNLWIASNQSQLGSWDKTVHAAETAGVNPFKPVSAAQARDLTGSPLALGGVCEDHAATVQPAKLVRGLRRVAAEMGAKIFEHTPMTGYDGTGPVTVSTPRGTIKAGRVVLAMNAWAASYKQVKPHLFVTSSDIIATAPVPELLNSEGLGDGMALSDSRRLILYWRSTPGGRVVFGKGGGWMSRGNHIDRRFTGESAFRDVVISRFHRLYPQLRDVRVERSWNGPIDYSSTGLPYFGPLDDRNPAVLTGLGYSGMGVVQAVLGGRILASLALGLRDQYATLPVTRRWSARIPPDPFRSIGAPIVKAAVSRKELMLDAEARPGRLTQFIAGLDPTAGPSQS